MSREKRWVVRPGDGEDVRAIVARAGEAATAVAEGRVFVGKRRARRPEDRVAVGDAVRIVAAVRAESGVVMFVREGLVACHKPAGLPTVPDHDGAEHSLVRIAERETGRAALRVTSRLDRDVSGVVFFAMDEAAETRLREARARGAYHRRYVAIAMGVLPASGTWDTPIGRAEDARRRAGGGPDAKPAETRFRRVGTAAEDASLLAVDPITGRTHQIRVHASEAGAPLLGDVDYGGPSRIVLATGTVIATTRIALHCARVVVAGMEAEAPLPAELASSWRALGGEPDALRRALDT